MAMSAEQFVEGLIRSGLMSAAEVAAFRQGFDRLPPDERPGDAQAMARQLVQAGRLTKYQASVVYQGKTKGLVFGEYIVLDKLGQGGMGVVLQAEHRRLGRVVAIKVLPAAAMKSPEVVRRFYREVAAAGRLDHPNIVMAYDAGEAEGVHYLAMEYVEGKDLARTVAEHGPFPVRQAVEYVLQAARGLEYAHRQGIVHRDIKPGNLLVDKKGTVKILDMGLARLTGAAAMFAGESERLTHSGEVMGTCDYMAPEQAEDTHGADHRADIYSLGCTLFRLLTGQAPYSGDSLIKVLLAHREAPIPSLRDKRPEVPAELDAIFQKMLSKQPDQRHQSMQEVIGDLENFLSGGPRPPPVPGPSPTAAEEASLAANLSFLEEMAPGPAGAATRQGVATEKAETLRRLAREDTGRSVATRVRQAVASARKRPVVMYAAVGTAAALLVVLAALFFTPPRPLGQGQGEGERGTGSERSEVPVPLSKPTGPHPSPLPKGEGTPPPLAVAPFDAVGARKHQEAWARYLGVPVEFTNSIGMKFVLIPPGEFDMGPAEAQHRVRITRPFFLGIGEVTVGEFRQFAAAARYKTEAESDGLESWGFSLERKDFTKRSFYNWRNPGFPQPDDHPVGIVTWNDAQAFCRWVSDKEGGTYRLPTEAEWEYACRAGTTTNWSSGEDEKSLEGYANFADASHRRARPSATWGVPWDDGFGLTAPLAGFRANPFGLFHMHGNVWEWCQDWFAADYDKNSPRDDPPGPASGQSRAQRGGSLDYIPQYCKSFSRLGQEPTYRNFNVGFRVLCEIPDNREQRQKLFQVKGETGQAPAHASLDASPAVFKPWPKGVLAYWRMDEGAGAIIKDASPLGLHGKIFGAAWAQDPGGRSVLQFDGRAGYAQILGRTLGNLTPPFSVELWVRVDAPPSPDVLESDMIDCVDHAGTAAGWGINLRGSSFPLALQVRMVGIPPGRGVDEYAISVPEAVPKSAWKHIVAVYDTAEIRAYVDGQIKAKAPHQGRPLGVLPVTLGRLAKVNQGYFCGAMRDVAVFDYALTPEEVKAHFEHGSPVHTTPQPEKAGSRAAEPHQAQAAAAPQPLVARQPTAPAGAKAPEDPAAAKRIEGRRRAETGYRQVMAPVARMLFAWHFAQAAQALEKMRFDEADLAARLAVRRDEVNRLTGLKARIIEKINAAEPRLKKAAIGLHGMNGDLTGADDKGITATLVSGKAEFIAWGELSQKTRENLLQLVVERDKPGDWLSAGLLAAACEDAASAEEYFARAASRGLKTEPHLTPLAAAAFARAEELLQDRQFHEADAALGSIQEKYAETPWLASNKELLEAARAKAKRGAMEAEAEKLYTEAAELFAQKELFDLKPVMERLKTDYAKSASVTDRERKPSIAEMDAAVAGLGKRLRVRQDGKGDFKTIQDAIDAAEPGTLVEIQDSGTYNERVEIRVSKSGLTLRGARGCWPVITSLGPTRGFPALVAVLASGVTLERLVLIHAAPSSERLFDALPAAIVIANGPFRLRATLIGFRKDQPLAFSFPDNCDFPSEIENCVLLSSVLIRSGTSFRNCLFLGAGLRSNSRIDVRFCTIPVRMSMANNGALGIWDSICSKVVISQSVGDGKIHDVDRCAVVGPDVPEALTKCFQADPLFRDPANLDFRLKSGSPCAAKAVDGGEIGCRYTPEIAELCRLALELRRRKMIEF